MYSTTEYANDFYDALKQWIDGNEFGFIGESM